VYSSSAARAALLVVEALGLKMSDLFSSGGFGEEEAGYKIRSLRDTLL
jgi:hypothetical protein